MTNPKRRQVAKRQAHNHGNGIAERTCLKMYCDKNAAKHREENLPKPWESKQLWLNFWRADCTQKESGGAEKEHVSKGVSVHQPPKQNEDICEPKRQQRDEYREVLPACHIT